MPKVSVIIPTYNRAGLICRAIDSVLAQTYRDLEVIVVDDGSTDQTQELLLEKYDGRIKYMRQENKGVSSARNRGIKEANGGYIAFLDSDDFWLPQKLDRQMAFFNNDPSIYLQYAYVDNRDEVRNIDFVEPRQVCLTVEDFIYKEAYIPVSSAILKKEILDETGLFDETLSAIEDYDLWWRIVSKFKVGFLPEVLAITIKHTGNLVNESKKMRLGHIAVSEKMLKQIVNRAGRAPVVNKFANNCYWLAKECYLEGRFGEAAKSLFRAIKAKPDVGRLFYAPGENALGKLNKLIKPYLFLGSTFFKSLKVKK